MENKELTLNEYQKRAMSTCMPSCDNFSYMFIGLIGEIGEFASKVAKDIRKEKAFIGWSEEANEADENNLFYTHLQDLAESRPALKAELGDCAWFLAGLCKVMGWTLEEVCQENLDKLASRKERGVIDGDGDNR